MAACTCLVDFGSGRQFADTHSKSLWFVWADKKSRARRSRLENEGRALGRKCLRANELEPNGGFRVSRIIRVITYLQEERKKNARPCTHPRSVSGVSCGGAEQSVPSPRVSGPQMTHNHLREHAQFPLTTQWQLRSLRRISLVIRVSGAGKAFATHFASSSAEAKAIETGSPLGFSLSPCLNEFTSASSPSQVEQLRERPCHQRTSRESSLEEELGHTRQ